MKLYRCLYKTEEVVLFKNKIISITQNRCEGSILNTHNYEINPERKHFFLFKEDALNFMKNYIGYDCLIGEYDIPEHLVLSNIGFSIYMNNKNRICLETAIPFEDIIKEANYKSDDVLDIIDYKIIKCDYPVELISPNEIEKSLYYEVFLLNKEHKNIFKLLGIKTDFDDTEHIKFDYIESPDISSIRKILLDYDLLDEKIAKKTLQF